MTQAEFRKSGWVKAFAQFDEQELATIILCIRSLLEMGLWTHLVDYCVYRIEELKEDKMIEEMEADVLH